MAPKVNIYQKGCTYERQWALCISLMIFALAVLAATVEATPLPMQLLFPNESLEATSTTKQSTDSAKPCPINGTRFDNKTQQCWKIKEKGPCPDTQIFYAVNRIHGDCECNLEEGIQSTAWVYNEKHDKCYKSYERAYCQPGEWLIFKDADGLPACVPNKCEKLQKEKPEENKENPVVLYKDACVRLAQPASIGECTDSLMIIIDPKTGKPVCSSELSSYNVGTVSGFKCRPGTRRDKLGKCRSVNSKVSFRPSP